MTKLTLETFKEGLDKIMEAQLDASLAAMNDTMDLLNQGITDGVDVELMTMTMVLAEKKLIKAITDMEAELVKTKKVAPPPAKEG